MRRRTFLLAAAFGFAALPAAAATPGVNPRRILFGQSAALRGPAGDLGTEMRKGILAAFAEANRDVGVNGRRLDLLAYDDHYEPELAIANTRRLVDEDQVFALIGAVGTPTSAASVPIAQERGVPFIAPFTGAEFLRDPSLSNVVNVRASYFQETEAIIDLVVTNMGLRRVAVLYQDDSYGRTGLAGVRQALERRGIEPVGVGTYMRNTTAVKAALLSLRARDPEAIVVVGAYQPSAVFTRWARKLGIDAAIFNLSFVGSNALAHAAGEAGEGLYITQVVPFPDGDLIPLTARYRAALSALDEASQPSFGSLEGYLAGRLAVEVLKRAPEPLTREGFLRTLADTGTFNIDGFELRYGPDDNRGTDRVFMTMIRGGKIVPVERPAL